MKDLEQRVAYLQGLADGLNMEDSKEGKVISEMLGVLEEIVERLAFLREEQEDMLEYVEGLDDDLSDLEDDFYDEDDEDEEDEDGDFVEIECPNCHETVCFDSAILYDDDLIEVTCPVCDTVVFVNGDEDDFEEEEDEKDGEEQE
jgi:ribosomal protein S27E